MHVGTHVCLHVYHIIVHMQHFQNLPCTHIVAYNFGMHISDDSEDMQYTSDTQHTKDPDTSQAHAWFATLLV